MVKVIPFRGLLYDKKKAGADLSKVCAPPYDVISEDMRRELHDKNAYNIIRVILGYSNPGDTSDDNVYTRAGKTFGGWVDNGILARDGQPAFYVYQQKYKLNGKTLSRIGFIGRMKIEDFGKNKVLPHEHTLSSPKTDRMNLIKQVGANLSPIFGLFSDYKGNISAILKKAAAKKPAIDIVINGERHKLWRIDDEKQTGKISELMKDKRIFIADGHHRYEVAKSYRDVASAEKKHNGNADYIMMYFADMDGANKLSVLATHRVIKNMPMLSDDDVVSKVKGVFKAVECKNWKELASKMAKKTKKHVFGFWGGKKYIFLELKDEKKALEMIEENKSVDWKKLDVSILHYLLFKKLLDVRAEEGNITYVKNPEEAISLVNKGSHACAFFLNPTKVQELTAVAESGDMMPQKSTYFYPKLLTGLVMNKFD